MSAVHKTAIELVQAAADDLEAALRLDASRFGEQRALLTRRGVGRLAAALLLGLGVATPDEIEWLQDLLHEHPARFYEGIVRPRLSARIFSLMTAMITRASEEFWVEMRISTEQLCSLIRGVLGEAFKAKQVSEDFALFMVDASDIVTLLDSFLIGIRGAAAVEKTHRFILELARTCILADMLVNVTAAYQALGGGSFNLIREPSSIEEAEDVLKAITGHSILACALDVLNGCRGGCRCRRASTTCTEFCKIYVCTDTSTQKDTGMAQGGGGQRQGG